MMQIPAIYVPCKRDPFEIDPQSQGLRFYSRFNTLEIALASSIQTHIYAALYSALDLI